MKYTGLNGKVYNLGQVLGRGGEGSAFCVQEDNGLVAKIYRSDISPEELSERERKLNLMAAMEVVTKINGVMALIWPEDALYDAHGNFAGYVMPRVAGCRMLRDVISDYSYRCDRHGEANMKERFRLAANIAKLMDSLHNDSIVIGDMNSLNLMVDCHGQVVLIDCDSMQITAPDGEVHRCKVGTAYTLAPEIQGAPIAFTQYTDQYGLAVILSQLLRDADPDYEASVSDQSAPITSMPVSNVIDLDRPGPIVFGMGDNNIRVWTMPKVDTLPDSLKALFRRAFDYDGSEESIRRRPSAKEWANALMACVE